MKKLLLAVTLLASSALHAQEVSLSSSANQGFLGSDGLSFASVLLRADTQKCLQEIGFKGLNQLSTVQKVELERVQSEKTTYYTFTVNYYKVLPTDQVVLSETKEWYIDVTDTVTFIGNDLKVACELGKSEKK